MFSKLERPAFWILLAGTFLFASWIRISSPPAASRSPDEKYYMYYARNTLADPYDAPREFVRKYNLHRHNWDFPIPLRIGYYYSIAAVMKLCDTTPERAGVGLSIACSIAQLAMVALFGLRFFNRWTVLTAVALLSVCPQDLAMARRVWSDGVAGCAAMILLWICAEISVRPRAKPWYAALWIWSAWFLLLKESGGFFFGFCVSGLALQSWLRDRSWQRVAWIFTGAIATALFSFLVMAVMCGGVDAALDIVRHNVQALPANDYLLTSQEGPWYSFPLGLWVLSPLTAFACAVALAALIIPGKSLGDVLLFDQRRRTITAGLGGLIVLVIATATFPAELKNLRYISFIVGPWYLMAALGLSYIATRARRAAIPVIAAAVLLSCWSDYSRYRELFVWREWPDLDIRHIVSSPFDHGF